MPMMRAILVKEPASRAPGAVSRLIHIRIPTAARATPPVMRTRAPTPCPGLVTASTWDHTSAVPQPVTISGPPQLTEDRSPSRHSSSRTAASRRAPPPRMERRRPETEMSSVGLPASRARLGGTAPAASAHGSPAGTAIHSST